jgi:hypothetical protein
MSKLVLCNFGVLLHGGSDDEEDARINVRGAWPFPFAGRGEVQILDHLLFQSELCAEVGDGVKG